MVLSDEDIKKRIGKDDLVIEPYNEDNVEPASVDLRLGEDHKSVRALGVIELGDDDNSIFHEELDSELTVHPDQLILSTTLERVEIPDDMVARVLGRSSLGRLGISVHQTAGYIDPGFKGQITLEIVNEGPVPVTISPGQRICQIVFEELSSPAMEPYGHEKSQYQNQSGATGSRMNFE